MNGFPRYFEAYGGLNALAKSRYFWGAVAITGVCSRYFTTPKWWDLSIAFVPGLVGFSIAGVAIFVSLGSDQLRARIAGKMPGEKEESPFMSFMAMFTHFIVIQLVALVAAFIAKAFYEARPLGQNPLAELSDSLREPFWLFGGLAFTYAILLCTALAVEIYRLASMIDDYQTRLNELGEGGGTDLPD
jgi:hypothetical protein